MTIDAPSGVLVRGDSIVLVAHAWQGDAAGGRLALEGVSFRWFSPESSVVAVHDRGDRSAAVFGLNTGTADVVAVPLDYQSAEAGVQALRVANTVEIDSVVPGTVLYGQQLTVYGTGLGRVSRVLLGEADLLPDTASFVGDSLGEGRQRFWVPYPARSDLVVAVAQEGFVGPRRGYHGRDPARRLRRAGGRGTSRDPAGVGARFGIRHSILEPTLALTGQGDNTRTLHFIREDTTRAVTFVVTTSAAVLAPFAAVLSSRPLQRLQDVASWASGIAHQFCKSMPVTIPDLPQAVRPFTSVQALAYAPGRDLYLSVVGDQNLAGRFGVQVLDGYRAADPRIPPDRFEENDECVAADTRFADPATRIDAFPFADTLSLDTPYDVDWIRFKVPFVGSDTTPRVVTARTQALLFGAADSSDLNLSLYRAVDFLEGTDSVLAAADQPGSTEALVSELDPGGGVLPARARRGGRGHAVCPLHRRRRRLRPASLAMNCPLCSTPLPDGTHFCSVCGADQSDPSAPARGRRAATQELAEALQAAAAGRYRVVRLLGRGAMGAVFLAEDLRLEREVAIKVLHPVLAEDAGFAGRFQREARISARLDHANIIPIYGVEQVGDFQYFVMKYVRGKSLSELMQEGALPAERAVPILWQAACGLGHAHQRGVVHRDVKPSNLMIDEAERVVVTDFGISKALEAGTQYTSIGQIIGTPRYLSPEQAMGEALDGRADQYSLAVVGYELMTGRLPLGAQTAHALIYAHINVVPSPARAIRPDIPSHVSDALARALAKTPAERFGTIEEFATALWPDRPVWVSQAPAAASPPSGPSAPAGQPEADVTVVTGSTRRRRLAGAAALAVVAAAGLLFVLLRERPAQSHKAADTVETAVQQPSAPPAVPMPGPTPSVVQPESTAAATRSDSTRAPTGMADSIVRSGTPAKPPKRPPAVRRTPPVAVDTIPTRSPAAAAVTGFLTINAVPYGTVSIDGVEIGDTPLVRYGVSPGEHLFTIAREGLRTDSGRFSVAAGNEVRMSRTLTKASP